MDDNLVNLAKLLSEAMLIAATIEYAEIVRRREGWRSLAQDRQLFAREGLRALVRVFVADQTSGLRYDSSGTPIRQLGRR